MNARVTISRFGLLVAASLLLNGCVGTAKRVTGSTLPNPVMPKIAPAPAESLVPTTPPDAEVAAQALNLARNNDFTGSAATLGTIRDRLRRRDASMAVVTAI